VRPGTLARTDEISETIRVTSKLAEDGEIDEVWNAPRDEVVPETPSRQSWVCITTSPSLHVMDDGELVLGVGVFGVVGKALG